MATKFAIEQRRFGLAKESVRGTAEAAPTKWYSVMKESDIDYKLNLLDDDAIRGDFSEYPKVPGRKRGAGKIKLPLDAQTIGEFLYSLLGTVSSVETPVITIGNTNKFIDFDIGAGALAASIALGTYAIGTTSATAGTLCKAIKDALLAADGTGTYTVTYSQATRKFSIIRSAGTFNIKWITGANIANGAAATLGYTADDTGLLTYVSDNTVDYLYQHTFSTNTSSIQRPSYTMFLDRGMNVMKYNLVVAKKLHLASPVDHLIMAEVDVLHKGEATGSIGSPSFPAQRYFSFQNADVKVGGSSITNVKTWTLEYDNGAFPLEVLNLSQDIDDILIRAKQKITGTFTSYFETVTERDKFMAGTTTSLRFLIQGATTGLGMVDITLPKINYTAYPYDAEDDLLAAKVGWEGVYDSVSSKAISVLLNNQDTAY
jgi:hypothetical protein